MTDETQDTAEAPARGRRSGPARAWSWLVDGLGALGTFLIGVLMVIICADVVARNLMGSSLPLVSELGALTLVMIVYLQLATTIRHDRLARTDLFYTRFRQKRPVAGGLLAAVFQSVAALGVGTLAWATLGIVEKDFSRGEYIGVTGIATLPTWPFRAVILLGLAVAAVQCVLKVAESIREMREGGAR